MSDDEISLRRKVTRRKPLSGDTGEISVVREPGADSGMADRSEIVSDASGLEVEQGPGILDEEALREAASWLADHLGADVVASVRDNPHLKTGLPSDLPVKEWLVRALKTIFGYDALVLVAERFRATIGPGARASGVASGGGLDGDLVHELRQRLKRSVPLGLVVRGFLDPEPENRGLMAALMEIVEDPGDEAGAFILAFCRGWTGVAEALDRGRGQPGETEEARVHRVDEALRRLLTRLKGRFVPQRRAVLRAVAETINTGFSDFDFVSPEDSMLVDPNLHNVTRAKGREVAQGRSFAVLRRATRAVYRFADVDTR